MSFDVPSITHQPSAVFAQQQSSVLANGAKILVMHYAQPAMLAEVDCRKVLVVQRLAW